MRILFAASEASPFIKTGGLGDVAGSLPAALNKKGADVRVCLPLYEAIKENFYDKLEFVTKFYVLLSWRALYCGVYRVKHNGVTYYFIDNEYYFKRKPAYGFFDDGERFAFFSKALLEMLPHIDFMPDIIHLNDWQTALVPVFLRGNYNHIAEYQRIKTVITIHNIEYQGKVSEDFLENVIGVSKDFRNVLWYDDCLNFLKSAIVLCDKITTVSESYAEEIKDPYYSHGLAGILNENAYKLSGIVNGIDNRAFNPKTDKYLWNKYDSGCLKNKQLNKKELQKKLGLKADENIPMLAMISRLVSHKGLDLVEYIFEEMMYENIQFVLLGTGDAQYENYFRSMAEKYPQRVSVNIMFDSELASQIYASADLFLMPSKSEPCGLAQLICMRYGTVPIVREVGGLKDTVVPINTETLEGSGYTFKSYNAHDMLGAVKRALEMYSNCEKWNAVLTNIMKQNHSWSISAEKYFAVYESLL